MKDSIAIFGTGLMGAGFAALLAYHGHSVRMVGRTESGCEAGIAAVRRNLEDYRSSGLINDEQISRCLARLRTTTDPADVRGLGFYFEAVQEVIEKKQAVYKTIEGICGPQSVILSMTSSLSPDILSAGMQHPDRFLVAHPWNPPHLVPCVEVVRGQQTSDTALAAASALLEELGREIVVLNRSIEGFIGNRIQHAMYREALYLVESGIATPEEIDRTILSSIGQRFANVGLLEYYDSCGLDLQFNVQSIVFPTLCNAAKPQKPLADCLASGHLGLKSGQGLFDWSKKDIDDFRQRKSQAFYKYLRPYEEINGSN